MAGQLTEDLALRQTVSSIATQQLAAGNQRTYLAIKRAVDVCVGSVLLLLACPLMAIIAIVIRADSLGPIIFRQRRIGRGGREFTIYKFRTMAITAPAYSYKVPFDDPRVTQTGRWLRRTGMDELPQLFNVVKGDMSLIGPRPELPFIVERYEDWQHIRHRIRPGITGWWQVNHRNEVPMHLNLDYDLYYLANMSWRLDMDIVWRTAKVILRGAREAAGRS